MRNSEKHRKNSRKFYADLEDKIDWIKRIGLFSIGVVATLLLIFVVVLFTNAFRLQPGAMIVLFMFLLTIMTGIVSVLYFEKKQSKKLKSELIKDKNFTPPLLEIRKSNRELNQSTFAPIGSVTDNTTELFTSKIPRTRTSGELG